MRKKHQSWITAYIESIEPKELNLELIDEKTDEALVAPHAAIVKQIIDKLTTQMTDALYSGDKDKVAMVNQVASLVGLGITQNKQAKGKTFSYKLKRK